MSAQDVIKQLEQLHKKIIKDCSTLLNTGRDFIKQKYVDLSLLEPYSNILESLCADLNGKINLIKNQAFECDMRKNNYYDCVQDQPIKFIQKTETGLMSLKKFIDSDDESDLDEEKSKTLTNCVFKEIEIAKVYNLEIPRTNFPVVDTLTDIPQFIHYYKGDAKRKAGVYVCMSPNMFIQIPLPDTIDPTRFESKINTIRCKHETIDKCFEIRDRYSKRNGISIKECTFVHKGEKYSKVSSIYRCQDLSSFGNLSSLNKDLKNLSLRDVKTLMFYSLTDLLLVYMWCRSIKHDTLVFDNIDTFT
jgi:hypothetical protein